MSAFENIIDQAMRKAADQIKKITSEQDRLEGELETQMGIFRDATNYLYRDDPEGFAKLIDDHHLNEPDTSIPNINRLRDAKREALGIGKTIYEQLKSFDKVMVNAWIKAERKQRACYTKLPDDHCKVEYGDGFILVSAYSKNCVRDWVKIGLTP